MVMPTNTRNSAPFAGTPRVGILAALLAITALGRVQAQTQKFELGDVQKIVAVSSPAISPDGKSIAIIVTRVNWDEDRHDSQLVLVDIATGAQRQLTNIRKGLSSPQFSPSGDRIAFLAETGEEKKAAEQIFVLPMNGGEPQRVTSAPLGVEQFAWRPDGARIAFVSPDEPPNQADIEKHHDLFEVGDNSFLDTAAPTPSHIWLVSASGGSAKRLTSGAWSLSKTAEASPPSSPLSWSPDGKQIVFSTNFTGRNNLWKVSAEGGWPIQLSQSDDRQSSATWSPDGKWIVFQSDHGGGEMYDLYAIPGNGGAVVNLTNTSEISETSPVWSPDGKSLAIAYKPKTSSASDIAILDWGTHAVRNLTNEKTPDHLWGGAIWSPDSKFIYATRSNAAFSDSDIFRMDSATGAQENLTRHDGEHRAHASSTSPDGRLLLVTSDKPGGYPNVGLLDVATKKLTWVTDLKWEADSGNFSPDGKQFTYEVNEDGRTDNYLADAATLKGTKLDVPAGLNSYAGNPTAFAPDGRRLLVSHQSSTQPGDLRVYDLAKRETRQLSYSAIASLTAAKIPPSHLVHYRSFDGKIISAFVWR